MLWWRQAGTTISKPNLYLQALHRNYSSHDRSLDMHVSHVRGELEALGCTLLQLETVWGIGYMATRVINEPALAALAALLRDNGCVEYGRHPRGSRAACRTAARSALTGMALPRRWRTSCATPSSILPPMAACASRVAGREDGRWHLWI